MPVIARKSPPEVEMSKPSYGLGMMDWYASDGGRRCCYCGRWAKPTDLVSQGGPIEGGYLDCAPACKRCVKEWQEAKR